MKKIITFVIGLCLLLPSLSATERTIRLITAKPETSHIGSVFLNGIDGWEASWNSSKILQMEIEAIDDVNNTITWTYTFSVDNDGVTTEFWFFLNRHYDWNKSEYHPGGSSSGNFTFSKDDPSASENIMTIDASSYVVSGDYTVVYINDAPNGTDAIYFIGSWGSSWDNTQPFQCTKTGNNQFMGVVMQHKEFKCFNRAGSWDYEEKITSGEDCVGASNRSSSTNATLTIDNICEWKKKAYPDPAATGNVTLTITAPEGTDKVYLVGAGDAFAHDWYLSEAIECTHVSGNIFTHTFENIESVTYKCYNRISWNGHGSWHFEEKTAGGGTVSNRTLSFSNGAEQSITVENWENKGYEQRDVTITITDVPQCTNQVWLRGGWLTEDWGASAHTIEAVQQPDGSFVATVPTVDGKHFKCYNRSDDWNTVEYNGSGAEIEQRTTSGTSMNISVAEWKTRADVCKGDVTVTITTPPGTEEVWLAGSGAVYAHNWYLSESVQCIKTADRTFTYTFENVSTVTFKCLNKNEAVSDEWVYKEVKADGSDQSDRIIDFSVASTYAFTVEKWNIPYQVGYNDQINNDATSACYDGQAVDIILTGRTLHSASFNTLCLPFGLASLTGTPLEGAAIKALDHTVREGDELQLYFTDADAIVAGKPYLVQPTSDLVEPVFEDVNISDDVEANEDAADGIRFRGILNPTHLASNPNILFLGAGNELFWPSNDGTNMRGMRAYFQLAGGAGNAPVRRVSIMQSPQTATDVETVESSTAPSRKVIENGLLLIKRDGVTYNVLGQQIK